MLDPYTNESSWVLKSAVRILEGFRGSDARVNFVVTADADDTRRFLGPLCDEFLVFCDPDRAVVKAMGLERLPAFVFVRVDGELVAKAEGWDPAAWREVAEVVAETTLLERAADPDRRRPEPVRRFAGHRLTVDRRGRRRSAPAPRPAGRRDLRPAARGARTSTGGRSSSPRRAPARRHSCRWPCSTSRGSADGRIVMLEPRRLATRAAARRMADLLGEQVGDTVGYQTRDERRIGPATRIEVVTEGILTRRLQNDPELPGVGLVIFDEVHERNLPTDLGLALALDVARNDPARPPAAGDVGDARHHGAGRACSATHR